MHPTLEREEQNHTVRTVSGRASKEGEITLKPTLFGQTSSLSLSLSLSLSMDPRALTSQRQY